MLSLARRIPQALVGAAVSTVLGTALADEAAIRKHLAESVPDLPKIDAITPTPVPGLYELRMGTSVLYSDEQGFYLFEGQLIDARTRTNVTAQRIAAFRAVDFKALPLEDAVVWKRGSGARRLVVFADPNCGYCKKFERDLQSIDDVTVYTFLFPILGGDSPQKAEAIWCAGNRTQAWRNWMLQGALAIRGDGCDTSALQRNLALGQKCGVKGTPGLIFEDGRQVPGAAEAADIERQLEQASDRVQR